MAAAYYSVHIPQYFFSIISQISDSYVLPHIHTLLFFAFSWFFLLTFLALKINCTYLNGIQAFWSLNLVESELRYTHALYCI